MNASFAAPSRRGRSRRPGTAAAVALAAVVVLVIAASALGGCARKKDVAGVPPEVVRIGYFANLSHAQAVLGVASGDFARAVAPSKVEGRVFNAGPSLIEALFAGEIDVGYVGPGPALAAFARSHGDGIRVVAGGAANGVVIVARKGSGIRTMADLAGRRVATPQLGNTQDLSARHFVRATLHGDAKNVVPIDNVEQPAMMARGEIDAAWVPEPWGERLIRESGATLVAEEKDLWPDREFSLTLVVTTPEFLARHGDVVEKILRVHRAWTERLARDPQAHVAELGDALFAITGKRLPPGVLSTAIGRVRLTDEPLEATLRTFSAWSHEAGFGRGVEDTRALIDATLLRRLAAADGAQSTARDRRSGIEGPSSTAGDRAPVVDERSR